MESIVLYLKSHSFTKFKIVMYSLNLIFVIISTNAFLECKKYKFIAPKEIGLSEAISFLLSKEFFIAGTIFLLFYLIFFILLRGVFELILTLFLEKYSNIDVNKSIKHLTKFMIIDLNGVSYFRGDFHKKTVERLIQLSGDSRKVMNICEISLSTFLAFILSHFFSGSPLNNLFVWSNWLLIVVFVLFLIFCVNIVINTAKSENLKDVLIKLSEISKSKQ